MIRALSLLLTALLVLVVACRANPSDEGDDSTPTTIAAPTTGAQTPPPIPERPSDFAEYPDAVARYLTAYPEAGEGDACLHELFQAWDMPYFSGDRSCRAGNADLDPDDEVAVVLAAPRPGEFEPFDYNVVVLDREPDGFAVVYEAGIQPFGTPEDNDLANVIVAMEDTNADGGGELVYNRPWCGAHTCFLHIHIVSGGDGAYTTLSPPPSPVDPQGGISMSYADYRLEDVDRDGSKELVLHGGSIGSVGAGPNRERTETWGWDGERYTLRETILDPPTYLYHAILDANALIGQSRSAEAEQAFVAAIEDGTLDRGGSLSGSQSVSAELESYAYLRAAVARFVSGGDLAGAVGYLDRAVSLDAPLHAPLAAAFRDAYAASADLAAACDAVRTYVEDHLAALTDFWNFGYGNPPFDAEAFCPFRPQ